MKNRKSNAAFIAVVVVAIIGIIAFYFYEVLVQHKPYDEHLFKLAAIVFALISTIIRLTRGGNGRNSLSTYEKAYAEELGNAFATRPALRKKLLCACRLYNENNFGKALKYLEQLISQAQTNEDAVPVLLFTALCYSDAGVHQEAIKAYYDILKRDPSQVRVYGNLGVLYVSLGDYEMALENYNNALELAEDDYLVYCNRANCYFKMGDYENAISDAETALEIKNNCKEAATLLAIIYALEGDEESKKKYYHIAITSGRSPEELNEAIEYFLNEVD